MYQDYAVSLTCANQESFARGGPTFCLFVFLVDEGKEDPYATISGQSSIHQRNTIPMAFRWRAYDGHTFNTSLVVALCFSVDPDQY